MTKFLTGRAAGPRWKIGRLSGLERMDDFELVVGSIQPPGIRCRDLYRVDVFSSEYLNWPYRCKERATGSHSGSEWSFDRLRKFKIGKFIQQSMLYTFLYPIFQIWEEPNWKLALNQGG
ncbi:hypothetical protein FNV43_RR06593 [Rhamnella rubrinervis]|uniref:Uncharacterized protein n=1 Tax=Rhamnella rubrinervis TaxID=2594499 RepID=A0A8K0HEU9_9ROSA|nr:hypothetical protein FNV43_RR06593 [Rhamnella rubrinervis]